MSSAGSDRVGVGMLYAGGAGLMVGTSVVHLSDPSLGWIGGSVIVAIGLGYEAFQRSLHTERDTDGT